MLGWPHCKDKLKNTFTCLKQSFSASSNKRSAIIVSQYSQKVLWRPVVESVHRWESPVSRNTNSRRPQTKTTGSHQWERPVTSSRQEDRAAQMQSVVHRQPPNHPQPKLSGNVSSIAVQSVPTGVCTSRTSLYSQQQACKMTLNLPGPYQWEISHLLLYSVHLQHFEHPDTFTSL